MGYYRQYEPIIINKPKLIIHIIPWAGTPERSQASSKNLGDVMHADLN
jgi:hypothetical protein